jgi:hypothetical protein
MTENGFRSRSENGPKTLAVKGKSRMPNREHPTMKSVQTPSPNRAMDSTA